VQDANGFGDVGGQGHGRCVGGVPIV
jgi:hypothetical protein